MKYKRQCRLEIKKPAILTYTVTWLDEKVAIVGRKIERLGKTWIIVWVSKMQLPEDYFE